MRNDNKNLADRANGYDWLVSLVVLIILIFLLRDNLMIFYDKDLSLIDNIISVSGTLFGFWITCLSMFIVFKTEDKYTKENFSKSLGRLIGNRKFNNFYLLFVKNLYCLGIIILLSFAIYFVSNLDIQMQVLFIIIYMFLICLTIIRTIVSLLAFKKIINILINIE